MKVGKRQVAFFTLAIFSGFIAWYSLGGVPSCAHFDINGFCKELLAVSNKEVMIGLNSNCFRLTEMSSRLCDYTFKLGVGSLVLGVTTLIVSIKEVIYTNVADNWGDKNS